MSASLDLDEYKSLHCKWLGANEPVSCMLIRSHILDMIYDRIVWGFQFSVDHGIVVPGLGVQSRDSILITPCASSFSCPNSTTSPGPCTRQHTSIHH